MTKKRKMEILEMLKDKVATETKNGICVYLSWLYMYGEIVESEASTIKRLIHKYKPTRTYGDYFFPKREAPPRIRLLNRIIKDIKEGKK